MAQHSIRYYKCPHCGSSEFTGRGYFYKKSTKTYIPRYACAQCKRSFSTRTLSATFKQKRPDLNSMICQLICSGVSLRQTARILECNYKTVSFKHKWMGLRAKNHNLKADLTSKTLQFDELETIEHTKLKPLTVVVAVNEDYKILGLKVGTIPPKGKTAGISYKKYGYRENQSHSKTKELLSEISQQISKPFEMIKSDAKPSYQKIVNEVFPDITYQQFVAADNKEKRREQKYLKSEKLIHDPLFEVNHICARLRDHIKRLTRRSWCTTKIKENLELNLHLYIAYKNNPNFI